MNKIINLLGVVLIFGTILISCNQNINSQSEEESGFINFCTPHFAEKLPGITKEIFSPNLISPDKKRHSKITISPNGKEVYWSYYDNEEQMRKIAFMTFENGHWSKESTADFNGQFDSDSPSFIGNSKIIFHSKRSVGNDRVKIIDDFWIIEKIKDGWSEPQALGFHKFYDFINMPMPSVANNGNIYFNGKFEGGNYNLGIYVSYFKNNTYSQPELLSQKINSKHLDWIPFIAPDESYLIFASGRKGKEGGTSDLYISYKEKNGEWMEPINMGDKINSNLEERFPSVTSDGKLLFFMSDVNMDAKYYWVDAKIINELRPKNLDK